MIFLLLSSVSSLASNGYFQYVQSPAEDKTPQTWSSEFSGAEFNSAKRFRVQGRARVFRAKCACSPTFTHEYMSTGLTEDAERTYSTCVPAGTVPSVPCDPTGEQKGEGVIDLN